MGTVEWFLGTHFQWMVTPEVIAVHLSQTGFAANLVEENNITIAVLHMRLHHTVLASL